MEKIKKVLISQIIYVVFIFSFLGIGYCAPDSADNKQCLRVPMMGFESKDRLRELMDRIESASSETGQMTGRRLKVFGGFEKFINLREAGDLFDRLKYVVVIGKSDPFRHVIRLLLAEKEKLKNPDEPNKMLYSYYRYPSNCRPCFVRVMRILKKFHFNAEPVTIEFPEEIYPDLNIDRHSFVVTEIGGEKVIVDIAADQFEPQGENRWADLGVVVLPVKVVEQYSERFWMYARYRAPADLSAKSLKQSIPVAVIRTQI